MRLIAMLLVTLLAAVPFVGCRTAPIHDVIDAKLSAQPASTPEDIDEAIWRAGRKLGWSIAVLRPGHLRGTLQVRRHVAIVSISHDGERFSIRFAGSENLGHEGDLIHRRYNLWVARLAEKIEAEPAMPMTRPAARGSTAPRGFGVTPEGFRDTP
jgi:hypothetical protein